MNKLSQAGFRWLVLTLVLCVPIAVHAQTTTTTDVRQFEVISVDGNNLVVRDQKGTHEYSVPPDFQFTVDGKPMAVGELKAGMRGTATITRTTTVRPVNVTTIKMGTVVSQTGRSIIIKEDNGKIHRFSQDDADARGVKIFMDDKAVRIFNLNPGDQVTATIVSAGAPEILTAQQVDAELAAATAASPSGTDAASAPAADQSADASAPTTKDAAAAAAPTTEEGTKKPWLWLLAVVLVAAIAGLIVRSRPKKIPIRPR